jgi:hypothetical protein
MPKLPALITALFAASLIAQPYAIAGDKVVVAVFDVEAKGVPLSPEVLSRLGSYVASRVAGSDGYSVVSEEQIHQQIEARKADSYKDCYDQSCQIEIGKELAAQKSLATSLLKLGSNCVASLTLFDLRTAATERAATVEGGCAEDEVVGSLKSALARLSMLADSNVTAEAPHDQVRSIPAEPSARVETTAPADWSGLDLDAFLGGAVIPSEFNKGRIAGDAAGPSFTVEAGFRIDLGGFYLRPLVCGEIMPLVDAGSTRIFGFLPGASVVVPIGIVEINTALLVGARFFHTDEVHQFGVIVQHSVSGTDVTLAADAGVMLRLFSGFGVGGLFRYSEEKGMAMFSGGVGVTIVL